MIEKRTFNLTEVRFQGRTSNTADDFEDLIDGGADEAEEGDEERSLTGYASVFNSPSEDLGGFTEIVAPGAFKRSLDAAASGDLNIYALWSHDMSQPLGSTRGGKLTLSEDANGLAFSLDTSRMTPAQLDAARDGELRMSFGFTVRSDTWEERDDGSIVRTLNDVDLFEVSPVILPAYSDTSAALRSLEAWRASKAEAITEPTEEVAPDFRGDLLAKVLMLRLRDNH